MVYLETLVLLEFLDYQLVHELQQVQRVQLVLMDLLVQDCPVVLVRLYYPADRRDQ